MNHFRRVAIVSDPLVQRGGAEKIVSDVLARIFPEAPIHAILYSAATGPSHIAHRVIPSILQRIPGAARRHRWLLPLYPAAVESIDLRGFDLIISSHHTAAKGILRSGEQRHICYCHTPMRALWERTLEELEELPAALRPLAARSLSRLREWDYAAAGRVDLFLANSVTTRDRIYRHYGRDSRIVYPAIDVERFSPDESVPIGDYYLVASRLVPYKRVDIAIGATAKLGRRLIIVGTGPVEAALKRAHGEYLGHVSDDRLIELIRGCRALIFPAFEDFGMTPVEVMSCGRPVIAFGKGGALETVVDGVTGVLAEEQTVDAFVDAIVRFEAQTFDRRRIVLNAKRFSFARFEAALDEAVSEVRQGTPRREHSRTGAFAGLRVDLAHPSWKTNYIDEPIRTRSADIEY